MFSFGKWRFPISYPFTNCLALLAFVVSTMKFIDIMTRTYNTIGSSWSFTTRQLGLFANRSVHSFILVIWFLISGTYKIIFLGNIFLPIHFFSKKSREYLFLCVQGIRFCWYGIMSSAYGCYLLKTLYTLKAIQLNKMRAFPDMTIILFSHGAFFGWISINPINGNTQWLTTMRAKCMHCASGAELPYPWPCSHEKSHRTPG